MASSEEWVPAFRIVSPRWESDAFSGDGAAKYGGRWNSPGRRAVYLAGSRSLAALEMLVHLTTPDSRAKPYLLFQVWIPRSHMEESRDSCRSLETGDQWLRSGRSLALRVPSVIIPEEPNYVVNPAHPWMQRIRVEKPVGFRFDHRL